MSVTYVIKSDKAEQTVSVSLDFLRGLYSAQLLAGMEQYILTRSLLNVIGQLPADVDIGFTMFNTEIPLEPIKLREYQRGDKHIKEYYLDVADMFVAYNKALADPLVFNPVILDVNAIKWDMTKTPFHVVANFSGPQSEKLMEEAFYDFFGTDLSQPPSFDQFSMMNEPQGPSGEQMNTIFRSTSDSDPSRYYIGTTPDGRNTFMIKVPTVGIQQFMQGFAAYFKWVTEGTNSRNVKEYLATSALPELYGYDYGQEVILQNAWDAPTMESQLPNNITKLNVRL